jgi:hypothetical protein
MIEHYGFLAEALPDGSEQREMQVGSMYRDLRPIVAGESSPRFELHELTVTRKEVVFLRLDAVAKQLRLEPEPMKYIHGVGQKVQSHAEWQDLGCRLINPAADADAV